MSGVHAHRFGAAAMCHNPRDMGTARGNADDDAKRILNVVRQLVRTLRLFEKEAQARYGLGAAQMFILHVLRQHDDISLNELADRTATDQSSASLAVASLVRQGLVERGTSETDKRQVRLALTAKGRAMARKAPIAAQERLLESAAAMPAKDRTRLIAMLRTLVRGMGATEERVPMLFQDEEAKPSRSRRPK